MRQPKAPCLNCEIRHLGCHITCEKYQEFDRLNNLFRQEKIRIAEENRVQNDIEHRRIKMASEGRMYRKKKGE